MTATCFKCKKNFIADRVKAYSGEGEIKAKFYKMTGNVFQCCGIETTDGVMCGKCHDGSKLEVNRA